MLDSPFASEDPKTRPLPDPRCPRLGRVVAVSGSQVIVLLDATLPGMPAPQLGALIKMRTPASTVFGLVNGLSVPVPSVDPDGLEREMKVVEIDLLGEVMGSAPGDDDRFRRGVSVFPALGDDVLAASRDDLRLVYTAAGVRVGTLHQDRALPAHVRTDDLLGKHFAVLGTTGSGKSCTVALILRALLSHHTNGHVLLLDLHNEYSRAFRDIAEVLDPDTLELPYWLLNFEEITEIVLGAGEREAEAAILGECIVAAKRRYTAEAERTELLTVDTPVPYRLSDVMRLLDEAMGKLDKPGDSVPFLRLKNRLNALQADKRFAFMFPGLSVRDNLARILSRLFRIPVAGKPITIVDLSSVPSEILNVVVSVLCRMTFDFALWSERAVPILLVCEEAHRYAPRSATSGFEPTKKALARIAKEGRKYGVSLCVVSQRPSELDMTVLSQCNTIFALRLNSQTDQDFVRGVISESSLGLLDFLPSLRNAEAIIVGEGVPTPVRVAIDALPDENRPRSATAVFSTAWDHDQAEETFVRGIVDRWRRQAR